MKDKSALPVTMGESFRIVKRLKGGSKRQKRLWEPWPIS